MTGIARQEPWVHPLRRTLLSCAFLCGLLGWYGHANGETGHPLDPLSEEEIARTAAIIADSGRTDETTRAAMITLMEPDKQQVLDWRDGDPHQRKAFAILRSKGETIEVVVNLDSGALEQWTAVPGAQPAIQSAEWSAAQRLVKQDPAWRRAMQRRGYTEFEAVFCDSLSAGYFGPSDLDEGRLIRMPCYDVAAARTNVYARPIEGLIATVDLDAMEVVDVLDTGPVESPEQAHGFDEASVDQLHAPMKPVRNTAPAGWNFETNGRMLTWQNWSMHLGFDQRFGPVLSLVSHRDGDAFRSVLYQAHVSEVFVPYMDPAPTWSFRTYMDAGEYGLGALSSALRPGLDCPEEARFFDATLSTFAGRSYDRPKVMCVFERDPAVPLWRHSEALNGAYEGRPATELVVRSIPSIAHYDYVIDWVFSQSGAIEVKIGATGIDAVKAVDIETVAAPGAVDVLQYGSLVAPGLMAVNHDHYFSLRLDFDVDGQVNRFVRERLSTVVLPRSSTRRSLWQLEEDPLPAEGAVSARQGPQVWRIENPDSTNRLGHHRSYQIQGHGPTSLLIADDWPQQRGAFSAHNLWVTVQHPGEQYAAGAYPNQSKGGDGLPRYVDGESISANDLVAWYTVGFHHVTRPEDWPILSTVWQSVKLRPYGFFDESPALGVRRHFVDEPS